MTAFSILFYSKFYSGVGDALRTLIPYMDSLTISPKANESHYNTVYSIISYKTNNYSENVHVK